MGRAAPAAAPAASTHDRYIDTIRAVALLAVVFGHWIATLPRTEGAAVVGTDHLLHLWSPAASVTWIWQVVPLFVFVSAAVATPSAARITDRDRPLAGWWAARALRLVRPTLTYLGVLTALVVVGWVVPAVGELMAVFDTSLTVHLWFLVMLLAVQLLLPAAIAAHRRYGLGAVAALAGSVAVVALVRALASPVDAGWGRVGEVVVGGPVWVAVPSLLLAWLVPQQLGVAWASGRFGGRRAGGAMLGIALVWLTATTSLGYPVAMIGGDLDTGSNVLPPTFALLGVMWLQIGVTLLIERPARRLLQVGAVWAVVRWLGLLGMPLYLWHKLAEVPAAALAAWTGWAIDVGSPGDPGFWAGRGWWVLWCAAAVVPVLGGVIAFELRRRTDVRPTRRRRAGAVGGAAAVVGLAVATAFGAVPGAVIGAVLVAIASWTLRERRPEAQPTDDGPTDGEPTDRESTGGESTGDEDLPATDRAPGPGRP
jgi:peptidoglycan/LPS O-acetylase OafA/YrhL